METLTTPVIASVLRLLTRDVRVGYKQSASQSLLSHACFLAAVFAATLRASPRSQDQTKCVPPVSE
eukprot:12796852-Alexandrium_andersonii.AAC.1